MEMKTVFACYLLLMLCHHCICKCENNWTKPMQHSVGSKGVFSVSVYVVEYLRLSQIIWDLIVCNSSGKPISKFITTDIDTNSSNSTYHENMASAWIYHEETIFQSSLTLSNLPLTMPDNQCIEFFMDVCGRAAIQQILEVKYCDNISHVTGKLNVTSPTKASWNSITSYTCIDAIAKIIVGNNYSNPLNNYSRNCLDDATWSGTHNVSCAFAPTAIIEEVDAPVNMTYDADGNITLLCNVHGGYPNATQLRYHVQPVGASSYYNDFEIGEVYTRKLSPELNKANFTCQGLNEFTKITDKTAGISKPIIPNVLFEPMSVGERLKSIKGVLGETTTLLYTFKANPLIVMENLILTFAGNGTKEEPLDRTAGDLSKNSTQTYTYNVKVTSVEQYGLYRLKVTSSVERFGTLTLERNLTGEDADVTTTINYQTTSGTDVNSTSEQDKGPSVNIYVIIVPVIGVIILGLIILIVCRIRKRQQKKDASIAEQRANPIYEESSANAPIDKEEKINPLYGSSSGAKTNAEKEERLNPLYGSTSHDEATSANKKKKDKVEKKNPLYATSDGDNFTEDAYAEIDKSKKKGSENPVFTGESTGDTYAEVKKTKKNKSGDAAPVEGTYAEVQKKKKTDKDGTLHGSCND